MAKEKIFKLIYDGEAKKMCFTPDNFSQLRDYFLSVFNIKSCQKYIFLGYTNDDPDKKIIFSEEEFKENIDKLKKLNNPAIFIDDFSEDDEKEKKNDLKNIEYIIKNLTFENDDKKLEEELSKKNEKITNYEKRINKLEKDIIKLLNIAEQHKLKKDNKYLDEKNSELTKLLNNLLEKNK